QPTSPLFPYTTLFRSDTAREERETIARRMDALLTGNAVLVLPAAPGIAPLRNRSQEELNDFRDRAMSLLCVAGLARLPQVSLPLDRKSTRLNSSHDQI